MCGIAGIMSFNGEAIARDRLKRMTDVIAHRGPDGEGFWHAPDTFTALGHRRLAIIDLSPEAAQPMGYLDRYTIILNGEIYNFRELKTVLQKKGYSFRTHSDTEVLLAMYAEHGRDCLQYLDGMFAFAIYDLQEKSLFCARDRFGEKPFYHAHDPAGNFLFASEAKALFAGGIPFLENGKMLFYYLAYQVVENPFDKTETFFRGIYSLPPAHALLLQQDGRMETFCYWSLDPVEVDEGISMDQAAGRLNELLHQSVGRRLWSDVPVGSSLSGGIDSSYLVRCIQDLLPSSSPRQQTFTARFDDVTKDEGPYVSLLSGKLSLINHQTWVTAGNFTEDVEQFVWHQEEPVGGPSPIAQWEVMKLAAKHGVTVLLDGQGADEVFAGYLHFFRPFLSGLYQQDKLAFRTERDAFTRRYPGVISFKHNFFLESIAPALLRELGRQRRRLILPPYLQDLHPDLVARFRHEPPPFRQFHSLNQALKYATSSYGLGKLLKLADRNAMAFGREVRLPFLSHELVEFAFSLPPQFKLKDGWSKYVMRKAIGQLLPDEICWRVDKLGYEPPAQKWMATPAMREQLKQATQTLAELGFLRTPVQGKDWFYWNACQFLTVFKNQVKGIS